MLIFRYKNRSTSFNAQKQTLTLSAMLCFNNCLFKAPPAKYLVSSDWSAHTRLSLYH